MQALKHSTNPRAPFYSLLNSIQGAIEASVTAPDHKMNENEKAVALHQIALQDTTEALQKLSRMRKDRRIKAMSNLLKAYLRKIEDNTISETWCKGLKPKTHVKNKLAKDTIRFMTALSMILKPTVPTKAISMTVQRYASDADELF